MARLEGLPGESVLSAKYNKKTNKKNMTAWLRFASEQITRLMEQRPFGRRDQSEGV